MQHNSKNPKKNVARNFFLLPTPYVALAGFLLLTTYYLHPTASSAAGNQFTVGVTVGAAAGGGGGGDTVAPTVSSLSPTNGATGVSATTTLGITFSELVNKAAGNVVVKKYFDGSVADTIAVSGAQVTLSGSTATIVLTNPLSLNTQYYVEVDSGTFTDQSSNSFGGISGNSSWVFTTADSEAPTILGVTATTTPTTATLTFTTSESAVATLKWGTTTSYNLGSASEVSYVVSHTMSITTLATNTVYYFRLTAKDASGNQSAPSTGTFTTQAEPPPLDTIPPANPNYFSAVPSPTSIALSWDNPPDTDFSAVRLMRRGSGYPASPTDGILVYDGTGESATDSSLAPSTRYYYTIFARDTAGNYSSGAIVSEVTLAGTLPLPPPAEEGPAGTGGTGTTTPPPVIFPPATSTSAGPFVGFPATGAPHRAIAELSLDDFIFIELGEAEKRIFPTGGVMRVDGKRNLKVTISYNKLPDVLKTITISIDRGDGGSWSSFLLRVNQEKTAFEAVLPPLEKEGSFPFSIDILDHEAQGQKKINGTLDVFASAVADIFPEEIARIVTETIEALETPVALIAPMFVPVGVAVGASQAVLLVTNVSSLYDLYLLLLKVIGLFTGLFRRKKSEPWGVVYDAVTKRPLDPAYVVARLRNAKNTKGEAITDLDGRYGFLLDPGEYLIVANKTHYKFPSDRLKGQPRDELYENLYFGEPFQIRQGGVVQYNIPLDPLEFDWNEFAKNQDKVFKIYSKKETIRLWIFNVVFYVGLGFSVLSFFISPSLQNGVIVGIYVAIIAFQSVWRATHKVVRVLHKATGRPLPFALIKVWLPGLHSVVKKTVTDKAGHFYFLVPPGRYYITVEEKLPDGTYGEVLRTTEIELSKGVAREDLLV